MFQGYQQGIQDCYNNIHILGAISEVSKVLALNGRSPGGYPGTPRNISPLVCKVVPPLPR